MLINFQPTKKYFYPGFYCKDFCSCFIISHKFSLKITFLQ
eukprot:bmy_18006T0